MSDPVAVASNTFVVPTESAPSVRATSNGAGEEPKVAFEDVPALAKIREEQRADKKRAGEASGSDCAPQSPPDSAVQAQPAKASKPTSAGGDVHPRGEAKDRSAEGQARVQGHEVKGDVAATLANGRTASVPGTPKATKGAAMAVSAKQGTVVAQVNSAKLQQPTHLPTVSKNDVASASSGSARVQAAVTDGKTGTDPLKKVVPGQDGKTGVVPEKEGASAATGTAGKVLEGTQEATAPRSRSAVPGQKMPDAKHPDGKTGSEKAIGQAQAAEAKVSVKSQPLSAEKPPEKSVAKVGAESGTVAEAAEKPQRNPSTSHHEGRHATLREATGVHPGKEAQVAAVASQGKDGQLAGLKEGLKEQADVSISAGSSSTTSSQRLSAESTSTSTFDGTALRSEARSVSDQILDSVRASLANADRQVTVRLNPPELGSVTVRFQEQGEQIRAVLEVARSETRHEVERALPEVLRSLQDAGVQIRRVEVVLADQSGKDMGKEQLQQDAWAQQQSSQQQTGDQRSPSATGWQPQGRVARGNPERDDAGLQSLSATGGINMLV